MAEVEPVQTHAVRMAVPPTPSGHMDEAARFGTVFAQPMSIVKINAITVPRDRFDEFEQRFAARAGRVSSAEGFEAFELLRPNDDRDVCLVITRWRSEDDFRAWMSGPDFAAGHGQHRERGPVGTASELWSFDVLELEGPKAR
jgi:heme-degrading monooxygenase HmoA